MEDIIVNGKELAYIKCNVGPRYFEDAEVNGVMETEENPTMPMVVDNGKEKRFIISIDVKEGRIVGWPAGVDAVTYYKICDDGTYTFMDVFGSTLKEINSYVPDFLAIFDEGFGDYMYLDIDENGYIKDWKLTQEMVDTAISRAFK